MGDTPERLPRLRRMNAAQVLRKQITEPMGFTRSIAMQRRFSMGIFLDALYSACGWSVTLQETENHTSVADRSEGSVIPRLDLTSSDLDGFMQELQGFHEAFSECLAVRTAGALFSLDGRAVQ